LWHPQRKYLTSPESTFCPLFFLFFSEVGKSAVSRKKEKFEHSADYTTYRKQKVKLNYYTVNEFQTNLVFSG